MISVPMEWLEYPIETLIKLEAIYQFWCSRELERAFYNFLPNRSAWYRNNLAYLRDYYGITDTFPA